MNGAESPVKKMKPTEFPYEPMEGKEIPEVVLKARENGAWLDVNTKEFFSNKKVVVFSLPGAFTPTCSSTHLPRYEQLYHLFQENGVDEVVCVSVNDGFVMNSWKDNQNVKNVKLLPDGNGDFTKLMKMDTDKSAIGFGLRSWRYSMLVDSGKIVKIFSEKVGGGDPFLVSNADTMLKFINKDVKIPPSIVLFTKLGCSFCTKAKELLTEKKLPFETVVCGLGGSVSLHAIRGVSGATSTPQVFFDGKLIGGYDELKKHLN